MQGFSFIIKTSQYVRVWIVILHILSGIILCNLPLFFFAKILALFLILCSFCYYRKCEGGHFGKNSLKMLIYHEGLWWAEVCRDLRLVKISPQTVVMGRIIFLCLKEAEGSQIFKQLLFAKDYPLSDFKQLARAIRLG